MLKPGVLYVNGAGRLVYMTELVHCYSWLCKYLALNLKAIAAGEMR